MEAGEGELEERDHAFVAPAAKGEAEGDGAVEGAVRAEAEGGGGVVAGGAVGEGAAVELVLQGEVPVAVSPGEVGAEATATEVVIVPDGEVETVGGEEGKRGAGQFADARGAEAGLGVAEQGGRGLKSGGDGAQSGEGGGAFEQLPGRALDETVLGLLGMMIGPVGVDENPVEEARLGTAGEEGVVGVENTLLAGRYQTNPTAAVNAQAGDAVTVPLPGDGDENQILGHTRKVRRGGEKSPA